MVKLNKSMNLKMFLRNSTVTASTSLKESVKIVKNRNLLAKKLKSKHQILMAAVALPNL